jgi:JmjC domain, hydroxylase
LLELTVCFFSSFPQAQGIPADDPVLAVWYFVRPRHVAAFVGLLGGDESVTQLRKVEEMDEVAQQLRAATGDEQAVVVVEQRAGQRVSVPPGWMHTVINLLPCVKLAWDHQVPENLAGYIESWKAHRQYKVAGDYVGLQGMLLQAALKLS